MKVYGPYYRKDGRKHVIIITENKRITKSYPRYLLEKHIGRELHKNETVDHIDNDFTNDSIENLQILTREENAAKAFEDPHKKRKIFSFICPICGINAVKYANHVKSNKKKGKDGPFCSRRCAGIYSHTKIKLD